jgi:hypothetical protein
LGPHLGSPDDKLVHRVFTPLRPADHHHSVVADVPLVDQTLEDGVGIDSQEPQGQLRRFRQIIRQGKNEPRHQDDD